jgi:CubicO group peptidase (beta-lactamase class C family)
MTRTLSSLLLLAAVGLGQDFGAKADAYVQSYVRDKMFRGVVLVAKDGKPVFRKGYGNANDEWDIPNAPDTRFRLGSITKQFTAVAILQLAEQGKLNVEHPLQKYYAEAPESWKGITIHHLLNHTSGIKSYTSIDKFFPKMSRDARTPAEIIRLTQDQALEFAPGEKYAYNNTGYILLGYIIEKVSGKSYADYVRDHIFEPAGMKDSGYDTASAVIKKRAAGYEANGANTPFLDMSLPYAAGSLYSTVDDLVKWDEALHANKLISRASFEAMTKPGKGNYGYGLVMQTIDGKPAQLHGGGINGFNTNMIRFPNEHVVAIALANQSSSAPDRIAVQLARMYLGADVQPRPLITEVTLTSAQLDALAGRYELAPNFVVRIWREGKEMRAQATNQRDLIVVAIAENKLYSRDADAQFEFHRGEDGKVTGMTLHQGGQKIPGERIGD